ncbi:MAG TPA: hypothetical protein VGJ41_15130 [Nocardioides sp.]
MTLSGGITSWTYGQLRRGSLYRYSAKATGTVTLKVLSSGELVQVDALGLSRL